MSFIISDVIRAAETLIKENKPLILSEDELDKRLKYFDDCGVMIAIDTRNRLATITIKLWEK